MMQQLSGMLTTLSLLGIVWAGTLQTQNHLSELEPALEAADSDSASDLSGVENRFVPLDYGFIFYPDGAGGKRTPSHSSSYPITTLAPTQGIGVKPFASGQRVLPEYAVVKPNRSIETQTDPQRITVIAPAASPNN